MYKEETPGHHMAVNGDAQMWPKTSFQVQVSQIFQLDLRIGNIFLER